MKNSTDIVKLHFCNSASISCPEHCQCKSVSVCHNKENWNNLASLIHNALSYSVLNGYNNFMGQSPL
jgi:hypothetical protein